MLFFGVIMSIMADFRDFVSSALAPEAPFVIWRKQGYFLGHKKRKKKTNHISDVIYLLVASCA